MRLGIISYDHAHMKTEHMVLSYLRDEGIDEIVIFALPFKNRPARNVAFAHRPDQSDSIPTRSLENLQRVSFHEWDGEENVASLVDVFVIAGAGILDVGFASGKPIVNAHPGIIPTTRGLDSFKWAIFEGDPVGVTVHLIDNEVDKGEILHIEQTPVFATDTLDTLAHRHYEVEMHLVRNVLELLDKRVTPSAPEKPAKMRMPADTEAEMFRRFDAWKDKYSC